MKFENQFVGFTIKQVLIDELGFSKKAITALKHKENGILLNASHATVRAVICEGDVLEIDVEDDTDGEKLVPSSTLPNIIYEDDNIVAANKPPYMPTHQSHGHFYDTLANSLAYHYSLLGRAFVFRSINRLDRNTSGIVLVAKNKVAAGKLSHQMKNDEISKSYIAILDGNIENDEGVISTYIRRKEESIIYREVCDEVPDAKIAITSYRVLARANGLTLVEATPITGRTHQLRVHFAHIGASILGDDLYGSPSPLIPRHALHAYKLCFTNPQNNQKMELFAPLSDDMKQIIIDNFGEKILPDGTKEQD